MGKRKSKLKNPESKSKIPTAVRSSAAPPRGSIFQEMLQPTFCTGSAPLKYSRPHRKCVLPGGVCARILPCGE
ncbi:UNVERIFIED_CONTAM: hypothetical protein Sradi_2171900 [Sesamum radiatum]|uniref:Uncharacterized protein n=1 Tax=Sesamum radiatum TaxID=300843 RepID=A0AAW2T000_SESRA